MSKELLAVLDMTEDEQIDFLFDRGHIDNDDYEHMAGNEPSKWRADIRHRVLADLAFRLRDEVVGHTPYSNRYFYNEAFDMVYKRAEENREEGTDKANWALDFARPIHWVVASLIAKELVNASN